MIFTSSSSSIQVHPFPSSCLDDSASYFFLEALLHGHSLQIDELSLEQRGRYDVKTNSIMGTCREHNHLFNLQVETLENVEALAAAVKDGRCHLGKEAMVVAAAQFSPTHYNLVPLLVSPTCKTKTGEESVIWLRQILRWWKETTAAELWSIASDGDAARRRAFHLLFMKSKVDANHPLWDDLGSLKLFNLYTGDADITMDFDPKHIIKCTSP